MQQDFRAHQEVYWCERSNVKMHQRRSGALKKSREQRMFASFSLEINNILIRRSENGTPVNDRRK